jgi:hypothetical protein
MSNLDIFNLDADVFVTKTAQSTNSKDLEFYKPYPEDGKDGVYKSLIRFLPNQANPTKSKIHKYYVYLQDPSTGNGMMVDCPSTVGKKSILKDMFWKLKNSNSAADQELAKKFSRKEDYYSLIQIVKDPNNRDLEGKIMLFKFGRKLNDMIEAQLKPEFGDPVNPYDLFNGKLFSVQVRKVGEWNNYDLCSFVGDRTPIEIEGQKMEKTKEDMEKIIDYLKTGPQNLESFDYKDWDSETENKVSNIIRNTVPNGRLLSEVLGGGSAPTQNYSAPSQSYSAPSTSSATDDFFDEISNKSVGVDTGSGEDFSPKKSSSSTGSSSLDDLYADL